MPRRDGTGPLGQGTKTGRGLGNCDSSNKPTGQGSGLGRNRGRVNS